MSAIMIFVAFGAAATIFAAIAWWSYALLSKRFADRHRLEKEQASTRKIVRQPWDDKAGARGIR
jgi:hypothetical protein